MTLKEFFSKFDYGTVAYLMQADKNGRVVPLFQCTYKDAAHGRYKDCKVEKARIVHQYPFLDIIIRVD